jgi:two-component system LytT family response regulator
MKLKALIADDEPLARERLKFLLSADQEIEIVGECRNGREVIATLKDERIDVLFLDIQMPGKSGFEVIEQLSPSDMPATVFVTAHNQYAVQAFEVSAVDYLTKPVEPQRLTATLARIKHRVASHEALITQAKLKSVLTTLEADAATAPPKEYPRRLLVHHGARDFFVNVDDVEWIEAADYYSCFHVGKKTFMLRQTIKQLASTLDPRKFVRVHRSVIVNVDQVREIFREGQREASPEKPTASEGSIVLLSGERLKMSKAGWQTLLALSRP